MKKLFQSMYDILKLSGLIILGEISENEALELLQ